jgi:tetratricopeptide (TPR) repeat protein
VAGLWDKAGDLYAKSGYPLRAAEAYEKKGESVKAAESYEKHFMENVSFSTTYSSTAPSADQKSALQAGRLYEQAGELGRALQILSRGGYFKEAGETCMKLGEHAKAAELFLRAEDPSRAAEAYEKGGDKVKAANLRGEVALKEERLAEAAAFFKEGQDYQRAAELFETIGLLAEAASAFEAAESWAAAGGVYIRAGMKDRAAFSYERAGDFEIAAKLYDEVGQSSKAISLYEKAGLTFKSGEAAAEAGQVDRAIALLQRVPPADDNYRGATEILARLFVQTGRAPLAIERLHKVLAGQTVSAATIDLYYWLAAAQEKIDPRDALSLYKKIQAESLDFRDVNDRLSRLEIALAVGGPRRIASAPAPPDAAPPAAASPTAAPPTPASAGGPTPGAPAARPPVVPPGAPPPRPNGGDASGSAPVGVAPAAKAPRFVPREEVGRGRLGVVFRAEDQLDGRSVALRVLPEALLRGAGVLAGLATDLKAAAALSHPNGVKVLGFVEREGQRCVVTEYVQGRTLAEALRTGHKMTVQQAHGLGRVLAQYLSFVHGKGLVHGSIRPSNIMVAAGVLKVADLGLGRLAHDQPDEMDYRAPENVLDVAGDLYAMAAVLYHLLTGVHPRTQSQGAALPLPSTFTSGVPEALDKILLRSLHPRAELRLASADEMLQELKVMVRLA